MLKLLEALDLELEISPRPADPGDPTSEMHRGVANLDALLDEYGEE